MAEPRKKKATVDSVFNDTEPAWSADKKIVPPKTTWEIVKEAFTVSFTLSLPMEAMKYYPAQHALMFGTVAYAVMILVFLYFLISGYQRQVLQEFISLDKNAGDCHEVEQSLNMKVMASRSGLWETDPDFVYSDAMIEFSFKKLTATDAQFLTLIKTDFGEQLSNVGIPGANRPFVENLLYWLHFGAEANDHNSLPQQLVFTATPNDAYNHRHIVTTTGSTIGLCTAPSSSWFDVPSASLVIEWDVPTFENAGCPSVASLESLGWEARDGNLSVIKIDTISTSTAVAVGMGILPSDDLEVVAKPIAVYKDLVMTRRFDPFFPRMKPLFCFQKMWGADTTASEGPWTDSSEQYAKYPEELASSSPLVTDNSTAAEAAYRKFPQGSAANPPICFVDFNGHLAVPAVHHYLPGCRSCGGNTSFPKYNIENYCDVFDVMIGLFFYPVVGEWTQAVDLYFKYNSFRELYDETYFSLYDISNGEANSTSYEFCDGCKLLGVNIWDDDTYLSPHFFSVSPSHCVDTHSLSTEALNKLGANPPTLLVEPYFRCKMFPDGALISAIGIAAGNLGAFGPIAILLVVMPLIYIYFAMAGAEPPAQKYDLVKIMKAQREFIEKVLGANDGTLEGVQEDGVIHKLGVELFELAQFEEGKASGTATGKYKTNKIAVVTKDADV